LQGFGELGKNGEKNKANSLQTSMALPTSEKPGLNFQKVPILISLEIVAGATTEQYGVSSPAPVPTQQGKANPEKAP